MILTSSAAVQGIRPNITINGDPADISRAFDDQKLALITYPRGGFVPATLAKSLGQEGRNIHFVTRNERGLKVVDGTIVNLVSASTAKGGFFDGSIDRDLIASDQAVVFNNCGELIGFFDKSIRSKVAMVRGLDDLTIVATTTGQHKMAAEICPSELEKQQMRDEQAKQEAEAQAAQAAKELEEAEAKARAEQEAAAAALKRAETEAKAKARCSSKGRKTKSR